MDHTKVQSCIKMVRSSDIHQFSEEFLKELHAKYSDPAVIAELKELGNVFLLDFAHNWPFFLSNKALTNAVLELSKSGIVSEQSMALEILASKNILHPQFLASHFKTVMAMKDRNLVS